MEIKRTGSVSVRYGDTISADDLKQFAEALPSGATVKVHQSRGDQRDPAMTTMTATWDLGPAPFPRPFPRVGLAHRFDGEVDGTLYGDGLKR